MLERWWRRQKPRVFLGAIAVAERTDLKRHLEQQELSESEPLDQALQRTLAEIFALPSAASVEDPLSSDLALDVWIPKFQSGEMVDIDLLDTNIILLWRPKVTVSSRLYSMATNKTRATFKVTEKMKWSHFLGRIFSWRALFRYQPFVRQDLELLLFQACARLLVKLQKAV